MNNILIWDRMLDIDIVFDVYSGEQIEQYQKDAELEFLSNATALLDNAKDKIIEYCIKNDGENIETQKIDNIFKYVKPTTIFIKKNRKKEHIVGVLCKYKFNQDDGLAVVFKNNILSEIGTENIIL